MPQEKRKVVDLVDRTDLERALAPTHELLAKILTVLERQTDSVPAVPASPRIERVIEPPVYSRHAPYSFFKDLATARQDAGAAERQALHARQMKDVNAKRDKLAAERLQREGIETETRVAPSRSTSDFAIPLWLNEAFAIAPRTGRVLASLIPNFPLPHGISTVNVPRITSGAKGVAGGDDQPVPSLDIVDAGTTANVVTVEGREDVALQLLEQSPAGAHLDWAIGLDLLSAYDQSIEGNLIAGPGTGAKTDIKMQGLIFLPGINIQQFTTATPFFSSSATAANNLYPYMGQASAQVGDVRALPPEAWLMRTSRWSWIATSIDNQNRPIVPPDLAPPKHRDGTGDGHDADGTVRPTSSIYGWPVFVDDAIPATFSTSGGTILADLGGTQDLIIACRPSDMLLLEGTPTCSVQVEVLSGTLQARIIYRNYAAGLTGRYPSGCAIVIGTGMTIQSGF